MLWYVEGTCKICLKSPVKVRHINLYSAGSEGLFCCSDCENELLEFVQRKCREAVEKKIENLRKKGNDK